MDALSLSAADEVARLRACLNALVSLMALPAIWGDGEPAQVVATLLDALVGTLDLACICARLRGPDGTTTLEITRTAPAWQGVAESGDLADVLGGPSWPPPSPWKTSVHAGAESLRLASARLGFEGDLGAIVAASPRVDFPTQTEQLLFDVAVNQAAIRLQQTRLLSAQKDIAIELDERVAQRTRELAQANARLQAEVVERARAEQALRDSESSSRVIVDSVPGLVVVLSSTGDVEHVNRQVLEYFGVTLTEMKAWRANDTVHPDDRQQVIDTLADAISTGSSFKVEHRLRRRDGRYLWFQARGLPLRPTDDRIGRWNVLLTEIEDRKRADEALRASEATLRKIINTLPVTAWSTRPDGYCEFLSQRWLEYAGFSAAEAEGWGWGSVIHPDDAPGLVEYWQSCLASGTAVDTEARMRRADGVYRWFLFRANPLRDEHGNIVRWYGTNIDIEDRKRASEALDKARSQLAHVTRVVSLGALAASIAHEVNQPLTGIVTNASTCVRLLTADPPNVDGALETARRTIRDGNRASEVVSRLRALFTKGDVAAEAFDLNDAAREVIALLSSDLQRSRIVLRAELDGEPLLVTGDRVQLQQVILNLVRNASDAMGGVDDRPRHLMVGTEREDGDHVRLTVHDVGVGLDLRSVDRMFDAFYTTKPDGMGIGLSVSRSIIERHAGRVWAAPNEGPGATFAFSIPCASQVQPGALRTTACDPYDRPMDSESPVTSNG